MKSYLLLFGLILFMPIAHYATAQTVATEHHEKMRAMQKEMQQMEKDMEAHRSMQHCMPVMEAYCQEIADLEYMEKRMKLMRTYMQYCSVNENDCGMPEMTGEMKAMREKMDALSLKMMPSGGLQNSIREKPSAPQAD
ncbi:MAG: hypothetical protein ACSLFB_14270 [Acidimicrobiales bacterium]